LQIEELVKKHENRVYRTAIAIMGNKADAEDVMQDVFLKVIEKTPAFESAEHEVAWLIRVTVNKCRSLLRSHWFKKREQLTDTYSASEADPDQNALIDIINSLPSKYRIVIFLHYYEGYKTNEIALITKQKESTVRSQLARARLQLKYFLEGEEQ
jgi:RNA polymerase sigma-70 factor (ECF subfamily)